MEAQARTGTLSGFIITYEGPSHFYHCGPRSIKNIFKIVFYDYLGIKMNITQPLFIAVYPLSCLSLFFF